LSDESYIRLAVEVAKKGRGEVSPNPLVGCIIVKDDRIISAGYHKKFGEKHAEVNAIENAKENIEGATLYVNLEPCSHFGKTPPCVDKIIENKIKKVVIGTNDMNPLVSGKGIKKLKSAGIDVKVGVLETECVELNKFFFKYITKKIPYVTLKAAITLDGKIADLSGRSKWISSLESRRYVHKLRASYDAILVGKNTINADDSRLNVRLVEGRDPKKIILDTDLSLSTNHRIFSDNKVGDLYVITAKKSGRKKNKIRKLESLKVKLIFIKKNSAGKIDLKSTLKELGKNNISSVLVEGGNQIYSSFIKEKLFDDIFLFMAPKFLGDGLPVIDNIGVKNIKDALKLNIKDVEKIGDNVLINLTR
jgi:diaminohydroxyphosphoribosylaminopyrimidine deaminase / 5-amino-6-(5-phosphoribosylamino)uracil reductase